MSVPALPLDPAFAETYSKMKRARTYSWIVLRIVDGGIKVVETVAPPAGVRELMTKLPERSCCYVVLDHRFDSDDGMIKSSKLFYVTWVPRLAGADEKLAYETQKGKALLKAVPGANEVTVGDPDEFKRKVYAVSNVRRKTTYGDDVEPISDDWMDE